MVVWRGHAFVGTVNNYTSEHERKLNEAPWIDSMIYGRELAPTTRTPHLQFWMWTVEPHTKAQVIRKCGGFVVFTPGPKKPPSYWYDDDGEHKDIAGLPLGYCKKDGDFVERGTPPSLEDYLEQCPKGQGVRCDLLAAKHAIEKGTPVEELIDDDSHFATMSRNEQFLCKYAARVRRRMTYALPEVSVFYGPTGAGKSKRAFEEAGDVDVHIQSAALGPWFEGYAGQDNVIFDEYRSSFAFGILNDLLGGQKGYRVPIKGSSVYWSPKKIWITAPRHPRDWYPNLCSEKDGEIEQLLRRCTRVVKFSLPGSG